MSTRQCAGIVLTRIITGIKNKGKWCKKTIREKTGEMFGEQKNCSNWMFRLVKGLKIDRKEVEVGRCMRGDKKLCLSEES